MKLIAKDDKTYEEMKEHFKDRKFFDEEKIFGSGIIEHFTRIENIIKIPITYFSDNDKDSGVIFSLMNSKNINNQHGVFVWNADPGMPLELKGKEYFEESTDTDDVDDYVFCDCLNIHKSLAPYISNKLKELGIIEDYIYPTKNINTRPLFETTVKNCT